MSVTETIAGWARELSEVGGRNTLLWAPEAPGGYLDLTTAHPGGVSRLLAGRHTALSDLVRESGAFEEALATARRIRRHTQVLLEDRGIAAGFLAIGVANWDPPRSGAVVEAPVLLRTAALVPTTAQETDFAVELGSGVEVNPALVNYLQSVAGVPVDAASLTSLTNLKGSGGFDPYPVYAALGRLCADVPGFAVAPRLVLGTYPYGKPTMVADVGSNAAWLAQVPLLAALADDEPARQKLAAPLPEIAPVPDPEQEVLALDLDGEQQEVLEHVRAGRSLVVRAAPGTGRTQTVAAVVAALAHAQRTVLYVTPSARSRRRLVDRLGEVGLADLVLDLTGAAEDRGPATRALGAALVRASSLDDGELAEQAEPRDRIERATDVAEREQALHDHVQALHERREPWGVTAYEIQQAMAELAARDPAPGSRVRLVGEHLRGLDRERVAGIVARLRGAAESGGWAADDRGDPWYAADIRDDADVARAREIVTRLSGDGLAEPCARLDEILAESSLPAARTPLDWGRAIETMHGVRRTLEVFRPEVFDIPLDEHVVATGDAAFREQAPVALGLTARWRVRRQATRLLRPGRPPADLHGELVSARAQRRLWHDLVGAGGRPEISPRLDEADELYSRLRDDLDWLAERLQTTDEGGGLLTTLRPALAARLDRLADRLDRLEVLPQVSGVLADLRAEGLSEVIDDFARRGVGAGQVEAEVEHIWWASIGLDITSHDRRYAGHDGRSLREQVDQLAELDTQARLVDAARVRAEVDRLARARARANPRQADLLHAQAGLTHSHLPFRDVLRETEQVLTALRPCLAVSPYAAAQLVVAGTAVDTVIIDDAHLLTVAESVSAVSRGAQVLVLGDPWAGGPTGFRVGLAGGRSRQPTEIAAGRPAAGPSLLAAAAAVLPVRELTWWHDPVDPRLALLDPAGRRHAVPAPVPPTLRLEVVDGTATVLPDNEDAIESTDAEAARIAELVQQHLERHVERSIAVVTLTPVAAEQVRVRLGHLGGRAAEVPVRAMSDAHDLTGDTVLLGVGYGRTPHGRVLHRFPTLAGDRADQDLLLATTLARTELVVVTTIDPDDLDPERLRTPGAARLLELLRAARAGGIPGEGAPPGDPLLRYLADRLHAEGLTVELGVGRGEHRVELAVGHRSCPGRWLVAVESDGPRYAALPGVRGRDRLRARQFERLGWQHTRVWSTDLYRDPAREVARILALVKRAAAEHQSARPRRARRAAPAPAGRPASPPEQTRDDTDVGWGERPEQSARPAESAHDRWLQEQRPPHWE